VRVVLQVTATPIAMPPIATQRGAEGADQGKAPGQRSYDGKAHADQARGVVEQRFTLEDVHQPLGNRHPGGDGGDRDRIGRREDRGECEGHGERHGRDQPVEQEADAQHGEDDEAQGELQDRALVPEQAFLGDAPAIEEEQRRQEQQEEDVGLQLDAEIGDRGDERAKPDLDEGER
jgi:hypothetical protein